MTDPLDALRSPITPVDPDPEFSAVLRERIVRALLAPSAQEETMNNVLLRDGISRNGTRAGDVSYIYFALPDLERGRAFYAAVLGWVFAPGRIDPASNQVDDVIPQVGLWDRPHPSGQHVHGAVLSYRVDDIVAARAAVHEHGGTADEVRREPYGLSTSCVDDQGIPFYLHELPSAGQAAPDLGVAPGDISYISLLVPDTAAAREFYGAVLGWQFAERSPQGTAPMIGIGDTRGDGAAVLCFRVDDIEAAVGRVRAAGGTASDPVQRPYAIEAACTDDQGTPFYLHEFAG